MALTTGTRLGPYEILGAVGAGGMGEVYKARDTRLDRTVAVKVLTSLSQADADARERFEREAKLLASLDHPHICALHDVGHDAGVDYLVMPYLTGETLSARMARGAMPLAEAIATASQIADALDRAHSHGIVHRDLKPGNVMLTKTGARLLDFGLARLDAPATAGPADDARTRSVLTKVGTVMGTLPYMSPEQLSAGHVDARSDIWAFGCLVYQMIAGRRPFEGASDAALIGAIAAADPPALSAQRPETPGALEDVVSAALAKDPDERWQHMRDVKRALAIVGRAAGTADPRAPARSPRRVAVPLFVLAAVAIAALGAVLWLRGPVAPPLIRFDVNAVGLGTIPQLTDVRPYFAASPDGRRLVFQATVDGRTDLWTKELDAEAAERLADTAGASSPFWSPDGQSVAFYAGGTLKRKTMGPGAAQTLCDADAQGLNGTWSADGVVLFAEWGTRRILRVPASGGAPVVVRQSKNPLAWVHFLPDGQHYLFNEYDLQASTRQLFVGALDSEAATPIPGVSGRAEVAAGHLIFWREGGIVAQKFDAGTYQLSGEAIRLADAVRAFAVTGFAAFSASRDLLVYQAGAVNNKLAWFDRNGIGLGTVGPLKTYVDVELSPDGSMLAATARHPRLGTNDVFVHEFDRDLTRQLTFESGTENAPAWAPDSKTIVYAADRSGPPSLHARSADGTGEERQLVEPVSGGPQAAGSFTPDGRSLLFFQPNPDTNYDVMRLTLDTNAPAVAIVKTKGQDLWPRLSPDGRWLAYSSNESGRSEIYVQSLDRAQDRRQVSRDGGFLPRWGADGRELHYVAGPGRNQVMVVSIASNAGRPQPGAPRVLFVAHAALNGYDVTRAGDRFLIIVPDPVAGRGTLGAVANWTRLVDR